jgi:stress-induced-phosphoprotein 1
MTDPSKAAHYKALGNDAFKDKRYEEAIEHFSKAIECNPTDQTFYSNRSACFVNIGRYEEALKDGENCIKINPSWPRGFQRKGNALEYLHRIDDAIATY